jgi:UDP-4-amino-4,6-dideoxy-L-N-acetyl-beta-L-altrosamine transaminase
MSIIPYNKQNVNKTDKKIVNQSLSEKLITTGKFVKQFEIKTKKFLKSNYSLSCSSGTAAIHMALMSINLKKNECVIMPAINFIASYNLCLSLESKIYLADVDSVTGQMTPKNVLDCIKKNKIKKVKLIITMYLGGSPNNIEEFYKLKKKYSCFLIEDACHAFGAKYTANEKSYMVGSCKHSDICTFSFHPVKPITTGEGGLITTNNKKIYERILLLRSHGIKRKKEYWKYNVEFPGFNYRLSDINCALGISQLKKIKTFQRKRQILANSYYKLLNKYKNICVLPKYDNKYKGAWHLFLAHFNFKNLKTNKDNFIKFMLKNNIALQYHYIPIFMFKNIIKNFKKSEIRKTFPGSINYYNTCVSLPLYYNLSIKDLNYVVRKISKFIKLHE